VPSGVRVGRPRDSTTGAAGLAPGGGQRGRWPGAGGLRVGSAVDAHPSDPGSRAPTGSRTACRPGRAGSTPEDRARRVATAGPAGVRPDEADDPATSDRFHRDGTSRPPGFGAVDPVGPLPTGVRYLAGGRGLPARPPAPGPADLG